MRRSSIVCDTSILVSAKNIISNHSWDEILLNRRYGHRWCVTMVTGYFHRPIIRMIHKMKAHFVDEMVVDHVQRTYRSSLMEHFLKSFMRRKLTLLMSESTIMCDAGFVVLLQSIYSNYSWDQNRLCWWEGINLFRRRYHSIPPEHSSESFMRWEPFL